MPKKIKVLSVDNEYDIVETIQTALSLNKGFEVDIALGGQEALEKMKKKGYNLVFLDIMMPRVNGMDVCKAMAKDAKLKKIPVVLVSALPVKSLNFRKSMKEFKELGLVKDVIQKPFTIKELTEKAKSAVKK